MPRVLTLVLSGLLLAASAARSAAVPAFPGAEGFGANAIGGRGGRVMEVTTLADTGPGSLRMCVTASGPRTCVFRVGGYITLKSQLKIDNPFLTIAGQTAPGDGITLRIDKEMTSGPLKIRTHDVVLRYFSLRPGLNPGHATGPESDYNIDAITIGERDSGVVRYEPYNVVIDHVSMAWTTDEVLNTAYRHRHITIQWSIMAEAINCDGTTVEGAGDRCTGKGPLLGGQAGQDVSFHHNLMTSNQGRNPMVKNRGGVVDLVNNVIFPSTDISLIADAQYGTQQLNFVGNYLQAVPGINLTYFGVRLAPPYQGGRVGSYKLYVQDNLGPMRPRDSDPEDWIVNATSPGDPTFNARTYVHPTLGPIMQAGRLAAPAVRTTSAGQAWEEVLHEAGASRRLTSQGALVLARDPIDTRIINDVRSGKSVTIQTAPWPGTWPPLRAGTGYPDIDHDGMADEWEQQHFGTLSRGSAKASSSDWDGDGYTDLEEFLNGTDPKTPNNGGQPATLSLPPRNLRAEP